MVETVTAATQERGITRLMKRILNKVRENTETEMRGEIGTMREAADKMEGIGTGIRKLNPRETRIMRKGDLINLLKPKNQKIFEPFLTI